jgi:hypothetical protein
MPCPCAASLEKEVAARRVRLSVSALKKGAPAKQARRSTRDADSSQTSAHLMYVWRELSFVAFCAHSKDSSAHARYSAAVIIESWASWIDASAIRSNAIPDLRCAKLRSHVGIDSPMSLTAAANHHRRRNAGRTSSPRAGRSGKTRR